VDSTVPSAVSQPVVAQLTRSAIFLVVTVKSPSGMCSANPVLLQNPPAGPPVRKGDGATLYVP